MSKFAISVILLVELAMILFAGIRILDYKKNVEAKDKNLFFVDRTSNAISYCDAKLYLTSVNVRSDDNKIYISNAQNKEIMNLPANSFIEDSNNSESKDQNQSIDATQKLCEIVIVSRDCYQGDKLNLAVYSCK